jgi:uncharacterized repeat protein (TIGR03803 family)
VRRTARSPPATASSSSRPTGGTVTVLHAFTGGADGSKPWASLIQATDGNFYGTTPRGGAFFLGVVFRVSMRVRPPPPNDFDGDGKSDAVVYRPSNGAWYILESSTNFTGFAYYRWGQPGDSLTGADRQWAHYRSPT